MRAGVGQAEHCAVVVEQGADLVFAVVGGIPNPFGPIFGAALLTALPELLRPLKDYRDILQGLILLLVIIYLPRGLVTIAQLRRTRRLQEIGAADVA